MFYNIGKFAHNLTAEKNKQIYFLTNSHYLFKKLQFHSIRIIHSRIFLFRPEFFVAFILN